MVGFVLASHQEDNGSQTFRSEPVLRFRNVEGEWKCINTP